MKTKTYQLVFFITFLLASTLWSCGARKTQKSHEEIIVTAKDTTAETVSAGSQTNTVTDQETRVEDNINWDETSATLTQVDPTKPIIITESNGKTTTFDNAVVQFGKKSGTSHTATTEKTKVAENKKDTITAIKITGKEIKTATIKDIKATDKKEWGGLLPLVIGAIASLVIIIWVIILIYLYKKQTIS